MTGRNVIEESLLDPYHRAAKEITITASFADEIRQALKETDSKAREAYKRQAAEYLGVGRCPEEPPLRLCFSGNGFCYFWLEEEGLC